MKKFIIVVLLIVSCVSLYAVTRKKVTPKKKVVEQVVDKHPGQFRNTKVWNTVDCELSDNGNYTFAATSENGVLKFIQLDSEGKLISALSTTNYSDGIISVMKLPDDKVNELITVIIKTDTLSIVDYKYGKNKECDKYYRFKSDNCELKFMKEWYKSALVLGTTFIMNGVETPIDIDHEYRNPKDVWKKFQSLSKKFDKIMEYNDGNETYHSKDREIDSYIKIAQDDFLYYKKMGYLKY